MNVLRPGFREHQRSENEIGWISPLGVWNCKRECGRHRQLDPLFLSTANYGKWHLTVLCNLLDQILKAYTQIWTNRNHPLVINFCISNFCYHVPFLQWVRRLSTGWLVNDDSLGGLV